MRTTTLLIHNLRRCFKGARARGWPPLTRPWQRIDPHRIQVFLRRRDGYKSTCRQMNDCCSTYLRCCCWWCCLARLLYVSLAYSSHTTREVAHLQHQLIVHSPHKLTNKHRQKWQKCAKNPATFSEFLAIRSSKKNRDATGTIMPLALDR